MRKRATRIAIAVALAVLSFAYGRYRYVSHNSATLTNPFDSTEHARLDSPFMDQDLIGDWVKDEIVFAIIIPVVFLAGGAVWAIRKQHLPSGLVSQAVRQQYPAKHDVATK